MLHHRHPLLQDTTPRLIHARSSITILALPLSPAKRSSYAVLRKGGRLTPWEYTVEHAAPTEIDIRVTHNGLCHSDVAMRNDDWGVSGFPFVPGHDIVGEVVDIGGGTAPAHGLQVGQRVGVGWVKSSCERCVHCLRGEINVCLKGSTPLIAFGGLGGFGEFVRVPASACYTIPDALESEHAAPLLCAGVTVFAPLRRHLRTGARVAVVGLGGLGHLAVQFASKLGASEVVAVDHNASKADEARQLGASELLSFDAFAAAEGRFDLVLNTASVDLSKGGAAEGFDLLKPLLPNGTFVQVGIPGGNAQIKMPLIPLVFAQKTVTGTIVGSRQDIQECLDFAAAAGIRPLIETMPLSKVNEAFDRLLAGKPRYRIVLVSDKASLEELRKEAQTHRSSAGEEINAASGGGGDGKGDGRGSDGSGPVC